jgi:hypothetical protein
MMQAEGSRALQYFSVKLALQLQTRFYRERKTHPISQMPAAMTRGKIGKTG